MTAPSVPRKRASKPKVRTGCDTCKKRRVKCDERKPRCLRCERLHHDCKYATQTAVPPWPSKNGRDLVPFAPAEKQFGGSSRFFYQPRCYTLNEREASYFDAYRQRTALRLGYTELWYRSVLRESARDPVIRHCVIALGALAHLGMGAAAPSRHGSEGPADPGERALVVDAEARRHYDQACLNYGEALTKFRDRVEREGSAVPARTVLLTSLLFLAVEQMQGNTEAVQQLAGNVLHMIKDKLVTFQAGATAACSAESRIAQPIDDDGVAEAELVLPRIFLTNLRGCHVDPYLRQVALSLHLDPAEVEVPDPRSTRLQIKRAWDRAIMRTSLYTERCRAALLDPATTLADVAEYRRGQAILLQRLGRWDVFASELLAVEPPNTPDGRVMPIMLNVILASLAMCKVHTLSCLDDPHVVDGGSGAYWDRYHDYIRQSVEHAEAIIDAVDWPMHDSTLSPIVHCVLQLSRDVDLRRRATALFRRLIAHDRSIVGPAQRRRATMTTPATPPPPLQTHMLAPADRASSEESDGGDPSTPESTTSSSCATFFSISGTSEEGGYGAVPRPGTLDAAAVAAAAYRFGKGATMSHRLCMGHLCLKTAIMDGSVELH